MFSLLAFTNIRKEMVNIMGYKKIKLLQGIVVVSDDYIIVEQTKTESSNYAGIVAEKNGTLPHYLVFSDKPISAYSIEEEDKLYDFLGELYPEVAEVRKQEVEVIFEDDIVVNADEWKAAPRLALFPVREVQNMDSLYFDTGVLRDKED